MLSNRITAKSLELNPARQARKRMLNESKDCHPAGCVNPPDRPPLPPPPLAVPGLLFPCTEPPALVDALCCLPSLAVWCSAISACGVGPSWHAPVSPLHSFNSFSGSVISCESSWCVYMLKFSAGTPRDSRYIPKCTLMRHIPSPQQSNCLPIERR